MSGNNIEVLISGQELCAVKLSTGAGDLNTVVLGFGTGTELHAVVSLDNGEELVLREISVCGGWIHYIEQKIIRQCFDPDAAVSIYLAASNARMRP